MPLHQVKVYFADCNFDRVSYFLIFNKIFQGKPAGPRFLSVYSRGPSRDVQWHLLGVYTMTNDTKNGKPTWRNNNTYQSIYFHGENNKH